MFMGLFSSSASITRFKVQGKLEEPVMETLVAGLKKNAIREIDEDPADKVVGWTSFEKPYQPDFEGNSLSIGTHWIFSLRIDKKKIPLKVVQKMCAQETVRKLTESGREFLLRRHWKAVARAVLINKGMLYGLRLDVSEVGHESLPPVGRPEDAAEAVIRR